jgi:hypothetical protein
MANQDTSTSKSGGIKGAIAAALGVSLLGLGAGFSLAAILISSTQEQAALDKSATPEDKLKVVAHGAENAADAGNAYVEDVEKSIGEYNVVTLQPIVTNFSDSTNVWIRLESSVLVEKNNEVKPDILAAQISQHLLAYLRTLKLADVQGSGTLPAISQDLNEIAVTVSDGNAKGVLISGLVFE